MRIENKAYLGEIKTPNNTYGMIIRRVIKNTWTKYGKYRVELELEEGKKVCWLSEKQMVRLEIAFDATPKGYSSKALCIVGVFDENLHYMYCINVKGERVFQLPAQFDLSDLVDED